MEYPWRVKLRRAGLHLDEFAEACEDYVRNSHVGFGYERDSALGAIRVTLRSDFEPPMLLGAIVGDVLHNLRSALDSIAWATCQRRGVSVGREKDVYFPIVADAARWKSQAGSQLPSVKDPQLQVFRELQPWFRAERAREMGVLFPTSTIARHPLFRLNELARSDRHRVPNLVVARAGDTWLSSPNGVTVTAIPGKFDLARAGDVVLEWRIDPPEAVDEVHPDGEVVLAFSQEAAAGRRTAHSELDSMRRSAAHAIRRLEVDVLGVVTAAQMGQLDEDERRLQEAEDAVERQSSEHHIIDAAYLDNFRRLSAAADEARSTYDDHWRETFG